MKKIGIVLALVLCSIAISHPGRTNSEGCHTNRKTGEYHCHGKTRNNSSSKSKIKTTTTKSRSTSSKTTAKSSNSKVKGVGAVGVTEELYFKDCDEAKKKGYSNIKKGQLGYRKGLDPDGNGIACER